MKNNLNGEESVQKALRVNLFYKTMRITTFLLFFCSFCALAGTANSQTAKVTIKKANVTLLDVLNEIENQTNYLFVYSNDVNVKRPISINVNNKAVNSILSTLFLGENISYTVEGTHIVLTKKEEVNVINRTQQNKDEKVTGVVVDENGEPLIGVSVVVKGTTNGTITNIDGEFVLNAKKGELLEISYIGYTTVNIKAGTQQRILMKEDTQKLDEVVVVGYGVTTKRAMIASVSTVDASQMENLPIVNITQALAGRSPGLIVKASGGGINKNSSVSIRGGGTPLIVIDGVIRDYSDFTTLSSEDIENMQILKDASATAVYGSRAANGIIQVTTKTGSKSNKPTIDYSFNQSWSQPNIWPDKLNSYDLAVMSNTVADMYNKNIPYSEDQLKSYKNHSDLFNFPDTDWKKLVLRDFAPTQKHSFSMHGGSEANRYFVSLGYIDQNSLYKTNTHNMQRYNFRVSQSSTIAAIGLKTTAQLDGYVQDVIQPASSTAGYNYDDPYYFVFSHIANMGPMGRAFNEYGLLENNGDNPVAETSTDAGYGKRKHTVINGKLAAEWALPWVKGLTIKASASYRHWGWHEKIWRKDPARYDPGATTPVTAAASQLQVQDQNGYSYTGQLLADYTHVFGKHSVSGLVGYEASYAFDNSLWGGRYNYVFNMDQLNSGPEANMKNGGTENESGRAGYIFQLKYNYDNKYFVEGSMRYDGSDQFPTNKRWGAFYAASLGWSVIDEIFMESIREKNIFNSLKLRASYGEVGLDNWENDPYKVSRFAYLASYGYNASQYVVGGTMQPGLSEGALPSPDISWFTTRQVDVGVDFASLNSRLFGSVDYFYYSTKGFLYAPDAMNVGYTAPLGTNLPKVVTDGEERRAGWEFQLGWRDRIGDWQYNVSANFTYFDKMWAINPAESLDGKMNPYTRVTQRKGYYGSMYNTLGFYTDADDILNSVQRQNSHDLAPGDLKYQDFNGDGLIDGADQYNQGKNGFPRGLFGLNLGLKWKGFALDMLIQGSTRFDTYLGSTVMMSDSQSGSTPRYGFQTDYWTPNNTDAKFPRLLYNLDTNGGNNSVTSNFWLINSHYTRLKDVRLSYDFKHKLLKKVLWISRLEAVVSGQNLITISPLTAYGMDPENASNNNYSYPLERTFSVGVNIGF